MEVHISSTQHACGGERMTFTDQYLPVIVGSENQTQIVRLLQQSLLPMEPFCKTNRKY